MSFKGKKFHQTCCQLCMGKRKKVLFLRMIGYNIRMLIGTLLSRIALFNNSKIKYIKIMKKILMLSKWINRLGKS